MSSFVSDYAHSKRQSNRWAAQQIVERADAFAWAVKQLRNVRFDRQEDMRTAASPEELEAAVAEWEEFIAWVRGVLGLPTTQQ